LEGLEFQHQRIGQQILQVRALLARGAASVVQAAAPPKRTRSLAARRRMAAAQRKRWAEFHKRQQEKAPTAKQPMKGAVTRQAPGKKAASR